MAISKMKLVSITADREYLKDVLMRFVKMDYFHPEPASKIVGAVHGLTTLSMDNPVTEVLNQTREVINEMGLELPYKEIENEDYELSDLKTWVDELYEKFSLVSTVQKELVEVIQENTDALVQVQNIEALDVNLDDLFECKFMKIRFGRLPLDSLDKLAFYRSRPFIFQSFHEDDNYSWCVYVTTEKYEGDVDNIFSSLYFERIRIPDFVHGKPDLAKESLSEEIKNDEMQLVKVNERLEAMKRECYEEFCLVYSELLFLNDTYEAQKFVVGLGERFSITGFIAVQDVDSLEQSFNDLKEVEIEVRPAHSDKRLSPPTKLKNGWFARPFSMFVEMYGTPSYDDIDPTPIVACTYTLLFGIMFGDLGQGLVLSLVSYILYKWKGMKLGEVGMRIGLSSAFFGFWYGSVFGNEELLTPFFTNVLHFSEKPIEVMGNSFIMPLLGGAVALGACLTFMSIGINIYLKYKHEDFGAFWFSQNGVAGFVFYFSFIVGVAAQFVLGIQVLTLPFILIFILFPLVLIFFQEPFTHKMAGEKMFPEGVGGFVLQTSFEAFEIILSFITNTISYLRVSGFVLSHAGLMLAVTVIMSMAGDIGGIFVAIIGNIIVMVLEGMIVGIQVLRLEFYEMFSRYFDGNGIVFKTLKD